MALNRRQMMILTAAALAGCKRSSGKPEVQPAATVPHVSSSAPVGEEFDAGPLDAFKEDDVYAEHRDDGFFVIRRAKALFAISSVCTHKGCKVRVAEDLSFFCKCHKSEFDKDGRVTKGPAKRDLPRIPVATDSQGHLHVALSVVPPPDGSGGGSLPV